LKRWHDFASEQTHGAQNLLLLQITKLYPSAPIFAGAISLHTALQSKVSITQRLYPATLGRPGDW
jgi:hypothetical protein